MRIRFVRNNGDHSIGDVVNVELATGRRLISLGVAVYDEPSPQKSIEDAPENRMVKTSKRK